MTVALNSENLTAARSLLVLEVILALVGIITNSILFMATYRSTGLKSKCNFLIGACALFDVIHLFGNFFGLTILFGDGHIDSFTCSALQLIPEIFVYAGCFCVLSIGIDRLFSVSFPVSYRNFDRRTYLAVHLMAIFLFASYAPFLMIFYYTTEPVICIIPEVFHGHGKYLWILAMLIIKVLTVFPYALTWLNLKSRDDSSYTKRVFRAIALVMIFDVGGWLVAVALTKIIYSIDMTDESRLVLQFCCGNIVHFCIAMKPIIYYTSSTEYRVVLRHFLGLDSFKPCPAHSSSQGAKTEEQTPSRKAHQYLITSADMHPLSSNQWSALRIVVGFELMFSTISIISNLLLIIVTWRTNSMRSSCNILIACCAVFDLAHSFGPLFESPILFGDGFIDSFTCSALQLVPEIGVYAGCFCVLSIGVDRLFSITCLSVYRRMNQRKYLLIHLFIILAFASYSPYLMIAYYKKHRVACSIPAPFHGRGQMLWSQAMIYVNFFTIIPYALTWMTLRSRQTSSYARRIFRSLLFVMIFDVGSWLAAVSMIKTIYTMQISDGTRFVLSFLSGWFVHFGIAIKPLIYYITSTEYRSAFRQLLFSSDASTILQKINSNKDKHSVVSQK